MNKITLSVCALPILASALLTFTGCGKNESAPDGIAGAAPPASNAANLLPPSPYDNFGLDALAHVDLVVEKEIVPMERPPSHHNHAPFRSPVFALGLPYENALAAPEGLPKCFFDYEHAHFNSGVLSPNTLLRLTGKNFISYSPVHSEDMASRAEYILDVARSSYHSVNRIKCRSGALATGQGESPMTVRMMREAFGGYLSIRPR